MSYSAPPSVLQLFKTNTPSLSYIAYAIYVLQDTHLQCAASYTPSLSWHAHLQYLNRRIHSDYPEILTWLSTFNTGNLTGRTVILILMSSPWWCDDKGSPSLSEGGSNLITSILCSERITVFCVQEKAVRQHTIQSPHFIASAVTYYSTETVSDNDSIVERFNKGLIPKEHSFR